MFRLETPEPWLRWWAISAMIVVCLLGILPSSFVRDGVSLIEAPTIVNYAVKAFITGTILFLVLGFYLRMLLECGFARAVPYRSGWLFLIILVPLVSAFIYYWTTRSAFYRRRIAQFPP